MTRILLIFFLILTSFSFAQTINVKALTLNSPLDGMCPASNITIQVRILNNGSSLINMANNPITVSATIITGQTVQNFSTTLNSGTIGANLMRNVSVTTSADFSVIGEYSVAMSATCKDDISPGIDATEIINVIPPPDAGDLTGNQAVCINTALTNITHATTGATGISNSGVSGVNGLPAGVSAAWAGNVITISGTPTASGTFNYSIPLTGGCGSVNATGTIVVTTANTAGAASSTSTLCIYTALTNITHATTGATGISNDGVSGANGLPAGVSAAWAGNTITISGTPSASGTFNYSIPLTGGCGSINATGTIVVTPNTTPTFDPLSTICSGDISFSLPTQSNEGYAGTWSPAFNNTTTGTYTFTANPIVGFCFLTARSTIKVTPNTTPTFTAVAPICSGATLRALPTQSNNGHNGTWLPALNNTVTTTYTFTPDAGSCGTTTTLTITVNNNHVPTFDPLTACQGDAGYVLPAQSNENYIGTWSPAFDNTTSGTYTFTVTPVPGECYTTATSLVTVSTNITPTFTALSPICSGVALSALPTTSNNGYHGTWSPALDNTATTTYTFTPDTYQCATTTTLTIMVKPKNTAGIASSSPTLNINTALTNITHSTTGATGINNSGVSGANGLPAGVNASWAGNIITISGIPTASGTFNYSIPLTGGCGNVYATGLIIVNSTISSGLSSTKVFVNAPSTVKINDTLQLAISTETLNTSDNIIAYQTDFFYDSTRYTYLSNNLVGALNPSGNVVVNSSKNGKLSISYMSQTALSGAGSLVKLKFKSNNTLGQGIFGLSNFLFNTTAITSLKSDTVTTIDGVPPTAKITYSTNPVRKGDSLLITVKFSEKMAVSPVPQLNLTGVNTLANTNLTKVNDTTYSYWWVVEKGNGAVNVNLATGKDLAGNGIVATPTQNPSFTVLPTLFGDIDTNKMVQAYDAALALQYSVGLNPLPTMDPLPWSNWRLAVANVDTVGNVTANDAALILQYSAKLITTFPADAKKRGGDAPTAEVTVTKEGNQLVFRHTGTLYAFNAYFKDNFNAFGQPEAKDKNAMIATNINATTYNIGLAASAPFTENEPFLIVPIISNTNISGTIDIVANTQEKSIAYGEAAGIKETNKEMLIVYPNPTKDIVTIKNAQGNTLRIMNVEGKEVFHQKLTGNLVDVSLKPLGAKGMYLVHIQNANNEMIQTKQIILE